MIAVLIGFATGLFTPLQTSINTNLRERLGMPQQASLANFVTAIPMLLLLALIVDGNVYLPLHDIAQQPLWIWIGGILGSAFITSNILLMSHLGSVSTVVLPILGQVAMGMIVDHFGLFNSIRIPMTPARGAGVALVLAGVFMIVNLGAKREKTKTREKKGPLVWVWRTMGVAAGMMVACQTAINTQLGRVADSPQRAALMNFLVGSCFLLIIYFITLARRKGNLPARKKTSWWMWTGGSIGAVFVVVTVHIATAIGTGMTVIVMLVGMIIGSMIIDALGILGAEKRPIGPLKICGAAIMVGGACMTYLL